jgi:galactokinase
MAAGFANAGYKIGGFNAYVTSQVIQGSGLSSSAAYEVIIGTIINGLFNDGKASEVEIAKMAQRAENEFFGKPSGLMDQMASSVGGLITIDFADTAAPIVKQINYNFTKSGYALCIIDTHGSHANLTGEYAAIPPEMKSVANCFGKEFMREVTREQVMENIPMLREKCGDRAVLRALHFLDDNERVGLEAAALEADNIEEFLRLINESGNSSLAYLQNIFAACSVKEQGLSVALYLAKKLLKGKGACRVHGGGFAGTIQAFVPSDRAEGYADEMNRIFGEGSCYILRIRPVGGIEITAD